jgi:hypothetical protein
LSYAEARMSVTFVKRNKPTDKSWQVTLQGKVWPSIHYYFLSSLDHPFRHIHLLMFPFVATSICLCSLLRRLSKSRATVDRTLKRKKRWPLAQHLSPALKTNSDPFLL